jgi:hypothetical protein
LVKTNGKKISKGSNITIEPSNPIQKDKQVGQLKGFLSFLLGNLVIKNWKNSCNPKAHPLIHKADNTVIS